MTKMLGRPEMLGGWGYIAKHIPGVQNVLSSGRDLTLAPIGARRQGTSDHEH